MKTEGISDRFYSIAPITPHSRCNLLLLPMPSVYLFVPVWFTLVSHCTQTWSTFFFGMTAQGVSHVYCRRYSTFYSTFNLNLLIKQLCFMQSNNVKLMKKRLLLKCFPVNFVKCLRTPFVQNTSGWLLLSSQRVNWKDWDAKNYTRN